MERFEQQHSPEKTISEFEDLRSLNLAERDLRTVSVEVLITADFDTKTIWPEQDKMPIGFNPEKNIDEAKILDLESENCIKKELTVVE